MEFIFGKTGRVESHPIPTIDFFIRHACTRTTAMLIVAIAEWANITDCQNSGHLQAWSSQGLPFPF